MTCQELEPFLLAYVDGEFESAETAEVESHLAECESCRNEVEHQREYKRRMREAARAAVGEGAPAALRQRITAAVAAEPRPRRSLRPFIIFPALGAGATAAGVVVYLSEANQQKASIYVTAAVAHHQKDLPLEVEDPQIPNIQKWFHGKVDFAPSRIPTLRQVSLRGARLSNLSDRPAAYVAFGNPSQRRISLFVFEAPGLQLTGGRRINNREVLLANEHGYNVALWKDDEIAYSLVGDLDEREILELVAASERRGAPAAAPVVTPVAAPAP